MFAFSGLRRCPAAYATLSRWLESLAHQAESLTGPPGPPWEALWTDIGLAAGHAHALKETDTLYSIVASLLRRARYPADASMWPVLARQLLEYSEVEASTVLYYPGVGEGLAGGPPSLSRPSEPPSSSSSSAAAAREENPPETRRFGRAPSREVLLLSGGVVPLSARVPVAEGTAVASFLRHFVAWRGGDETVGRRGVAGGGAMSAALMDVFRRNAETLQFDRLADAVASYMDLLEAPAPDAASATGTWRTDELVSFGEALCAALPREALGPRLVLHFLTGPAASPGAEAEVSHLLRTAPVFEMQRRLRLLHVALREFGRTFERAAAASRVTPMLRRAYNYVDLLLQHNAIRDNPLRLEEAEGQRLRGAAASCLLRALRLETASAEVFLRAAMEIVDRAPPSLAVEAELLAGKMGLLEMSELDADGRGAVYADLLTSLRHILHLRPRPEAGDDARGVEAVSPMDEDPAEEAAAAARLVQVAHERVLRALSEAHDEERINEAYGVVVAHKYHGLRVTPEVIRPLLEVLSRRGDCRVFNLVDLCVLYSNCTVDMDTIGYLFRTCAVAADFHRAHTLLQLLQEVIPGFLLKANDTVMEALRELGLVGSEPFHLFVSEEERLVRTTVGPPPPPLRVLPSAASN